VSKPAARLELAAALVPPILVIALGWALLHLQGYFLVDDSYISFRYARNLAEGHGLVWNPGEPVEGYTNLLWVILLSPFAWAKLDLVVPAAALGTLVSCGSVEVLRRIAGLAWPERSPVERALPGMLLAIQPSFAFWSTSGMETPLFTFLVLVAAYAILRAREDPRMRWVATGALVLSYLTRPEGLLVAAVFGGVELATFPGPWRLRVRRLVGPTLVIAAVVGCHVLIRLRYYGYPLPNTFYAKVIPGEMALGRGLRHLGAFLAAGGLAVVPGLFLLGRQARRAPLLLGYALLCVYVAYLLFIGGDLPRWYRFYVPLIPLCLLTVLVFRRAWMAGAIALVTLIAWPRAEPGLSPVLRIVGTGVRQALLPFYRSCPAESLVAASDVGFIGYYTGLRIIDAWGLNDVHIAHLRVDPNPHAGFAHDKQDWLYILTLRPDYIFTFRPEATPPLPVPGYDLCAPTVIPFRSVYRRSLPLAEWERGLGMPAGYRRTLMLPPPCAPAIPEGGWK
jgi:hypothetical protein